nr:PREDICTED: uncharacterized protein LOC109039708 [Bemisia tabaci]XP_018910868.1 PREDICTED: uncharacterized protein LOC109039708 [Bemisia tabaci]
MGSLQMNRSNMDGDNISPFNNQKLDQIKKILHQDVSKELEEAIKIAKEINNRIYQVHRNILVYQKLNPSRKIIFPESEWRREICLNNGGLKEKLGTCGASRLQGISSANKVTSLDEPSSSGTQILFPTSSASSPACSSASSTCVGNGGSSLKPSVKQNSPVLPCTRFYPSGNENGSIGPDNRTSIDLNISEDKSHPNVSDSQSSIVLYDKYLKVADQVWQISIDHDYLKENIWAEQTKHRKHSLLTLSSSKLISTDANTISKETSSPPSKRMKIDLLRGFEGDLKNSFYNSALPTSTVNGENIEDIKFDDFWNSSTYFDQDMMTCNQSLFSHNNLDLSSVCDIPVNIDDECSEGYLFTSSESSKDSQNLPRDLLKNLGDSFTNKALVSHSPVKLRFTIGTVSKQLLPSEKSCHETHIWKIYVRNTFAQDAPLDNYITKIRFLIHDSYAPNNLIERKEPPYEITRRGWGEFPIRVQIFFRFNKKPICLVHQLSLVRNVINILTLGIQKNYEIVIPNLVTSAPLSKKVDSTYHSGVLNDGLWRSSMSSSVVKDLFDFKIKEINTVAKINELISQDAVPHVNSSQTLVNISSWSTVPFKELKSQLFAEDDFYANFSDLNQIRVRISSINNYCERIVFLLDILPIITPHALLKWYKRVHPYSCPSREIFDSWPSGKQRASEFSRARMIKSLAALNPADDWSTNEVVLFARNKETHFQNDPAFKASLVSLAKTMALQQLSELEDELAKSENSEFIDIV